MLLFRSVIAVVTEKMIRLIHRAAAERYEFTTPLLLQYCGPTHKDRTMHHVGHPSVLMTMLLTYTSSISYAKAKRILETRCNNLDNEVWRGP